MRDITGTWIAWARGLRRRWSRRRTSCVSLDLVWLRYGPTVRPGQGRSPAHRSLTVRLSIAPTIAIQWASQIREIGNRGTAVRRAAASSTAISRSLSLRRASPPVLHDGTVDAATNSSNGSSRSPGPAPAPLVTLSPVRCGTVRAHSALTPGRGRFEAPVALLHTRMPADARRFASVATVSRRTRIEPPVLAPPPMVSRTTPPTVMSGAAQPQQNVYDVHSPLGFAMNGRGSWMSTPAPLGSAMPPGFLDSVTDHVVREIDSRVRARRERLGKV